MGKLTNGRDPIPEFETLGDIAEFWDNHSTADYDDVTHEVYFEVNIHPKDVTISLLPELGQTLNTLASARGISVETLVNVWLTEKVLESG